MRADPFYAENAHFKAATFLHIIHNGGWQYFDSFYRYERGFDHFSLFNLPHYRAPEFLDPRNPSNINCMAAAVRFADRFITVSPSYALQIESACDGLEDLLHDVIGINNAIGRDFTTRARKRARISGYVETFYPALLERLEHDENLKSRVEQRYPELLEGHHACESIRSKPRRETVTRMRDKLLLQLKHGLDVDPDKILFAMIHRIAEQKGFQLLLEKSERLFKQLGYQGIIGGQAAPGDRRGEELVRGLLLLQRGRRRVSLLGLRFPLGLRCHVPMCRILSIRQRGNTPPSPTSRCSDLAAPGAVGCPLHGYPLGRPIPYRRPGTTARPPVPGTRLRSRRAGTR